MSDVKPNYAGLVALAASSVALGAVMAAAVGLLRSGQVEEGSRRRRERLAAEAEEEEPEARTKASAAVGRRGSTNAQPDEPDAGCGFSMEEALRMSDEAHARVKDLKPLEVLAQLQRGNARFWTGSAKRPEKTAFQRRSLISKQYPTVAILGCSDSRVPIEIVFDMGLGDIFVIRVAGNCLRLPNTPAPADPGCIADSATLASLQYAVHHLKVKVVIVMGHEGCGAVKAAQIAPEAIGKEPLYLRNLLTGLRSGLNLQRLAKVRDAKAKDREAVVTNVKRQVEMLVEDLPIMEKVMASELMIVGAFYEISSGIVDFFHEVSHDGGKDMDLSPVRGVERQPSRGVLTRLDTRKLRMHDDEDAS